MITKHKFWINSRALRFHSCDLELSWIQILLPDLAVSKYLIRSHGARVAPPSHLCRTPGNWTEDYDIFCQSCAYWFWFECSVYLCRADTTEAFIEFCVLHCICIYPQSTSCLLHPSMSVSVFLSEMRKLWGAGLRSDKTKCVGTRICRHIFKTILHCVDWLC